MSAIEIEVPEFMKAFRYVRPVIDLSADGMKVIEWQGAHAVEDVVLGRWVKFRLYKGTWVELRGDVWRWDLGEVSHE